MEKRTGEGTFAVAIQRNSTMRLGYQVQLQFVITQHAPLTFFFQESPLPPYFRRKHGGRGVKKGRKRRCTNDEIPRFLQLRYSS